MKQRPTPLTDKEEAIAEYAHTQTRSGETLEQVVAYLTRHGLPTLTLKQLTAWVAEFRRRQGQHEEDPLGGERDESRRAERMEARMAQAAESIPGAAELLGLNALRQSVSEQSWNEPMREFMSKALDFLVPEIRTAKEYLAETTIHIPKDGHYEVWGGGERRPMTRTTYLAIFDRHGDLACVHPRTRPRGRPRASKGATALNVRTLRLDIQCDTHAILQRLIQWVLEFRPGRHPPMTQVALAELMERTKQAISHQRLLAMDKVRVATGGRAGFRGTRNLRRRNTA